LLERRLTTKSYYAVAVDLHTQTALFASIIAFAIGTGVLLRAKKQHGRWSFTAFSASVSFWYGTTALASVSPSTPFILRANLTGAVLLPLAAAHFLRRFIHPAAARAAWLLRAGVVAAGLLVTAAWYPSVRPAARSPAIFAYMVVLFLATLAYVARSTSLGTSSRFQRARLRFLAVLGALSGTFTAVDYLKLFGLDTPPVGTALTLVFLYLLAQSVLRDRLIDLYEVSGRIAVLAALSCLLAGVFWALTAFTHHALFMHAVAAAIAVLLVYDPVRQRVEARISQLFFRERYDLERHLGELRARLMHVLDLGDVPDALLPELERSRRVTHAALYLLADDMRGYVLRGYLGTQPVQRLERAAVRPLLDALATEPVLRMELVEERMDAQVERHAERDAETCHEIVQTLEAMHASLCIALASGREIYGFLCVRDERLRDAFSPEEVQLFAGLANQLVTTVENSRLFARMKERDRLATMGEMAAGLAHEIRNPLGAIKASAQYLAETPRDDTGSREFLDIIVEEVDRLNRVLGSFLEYADPTRGDLVRACDVNAVVERTVQVLGLDESKAGLTQALRLAPGLPRVSIDAERLRQVLINLVQNARDAVELGGKVQVETALAPTAQDGQRWVEIRVQDTGGGIPEQVLRRLFEPFVSTKQRGTGLGLAISQRIITSAGGRILVHSTPHQGSTFTVLLPADGGDSAAWPGVVGEPGATAAAREPVEMSAESGARELPSSATLKR
jgi:two-component system sensor histidine kinase HydH